MCDLGKKVRTTLTIDEDVLRTAMQIGINVSQFCENALREGIEKLRNPKNPSESDSASPPPVFGEAFSKKGSVEPRAGFGPATITLPR